jgi:hypothetical protein
MGHPLGQVGAELGQFASPAEAHEANFKTALAELEGMLARTGPVCDAAAFQRVQQLVGRLSAEASSFTNVAKPDLDRYARAAASVRAWEQAFARCYTPTTVDPAPSSRKKLAVGAGVVAGLLGALGLWYALRD